MHSDATPDAATGAQDACGKTDAPSRRESRARLFARIAARHNPHLGPGYLVTALAERARDRTA